MFAGSPSKVATVNPAHSASAASSVKSLRPSRAARRCASRITSKRNACGVCAMRSRARSGVASTSPASPTSLIVSVTGIAGTAAPVRPAASIAREITRRRHEGPRGVVDQNDVGLLARPALQVRHAPTPAASRRHWRAADGADPLTAALKNAASSGFTTGCTAKTWDGGKTAPSPGKSRSVRRSTDIALVRPRRREARGRLRQGWLRSAQVSALGSIQAI